MQVTGTVSTIRFRNEENGWTVLVLSTEDGDITCTGTFLFVGEGEDWTLEGDLVYHPKYGEQIKVISGSKLQPKTRDQVERYLASGLIPHVGPKTAKKLVDRFGEEVIEKIIDQPKLLLEIEGIGEKKADKILEALLQQQSGRETAIYLQGLEIGPKTAAQLVQAYGEDVRAVIENNPYQLIEDIEGIGFRTADRIAQKSGLKADSPFRWKAGLLYLLQSEARDQGACYLTNEELRTGIEKLLGDRTDHLDDYLFDLEIGGKLVHDHEGSRWYNNAIYELELGIAAKLSAMILNGEGKDKLYLDQEEIEREMRLTLSPTQRTAIGLAAENKVMVLTGGPGTGKTTVLRAVLKLFDLNGLNIQLAAPTGRAAKRMEESTGREASTLHRLLGYRGGESVGLQPEKNEDDPLTCDGLIVDEASMIDIYLMGDLIKALPEEARLVFVGDVDQLPSVGPGNVLRDLIRSEVIPTVKLDTVYRQEEDSLIVSNAHRINHGAVPVLNKTDKDFFFIDCLRPEDCLDLLEDLVTRRLPDHYGLDPRKDIQVLSAMKKGPCGVDNLNFRLQACLNPKKEGKEDLLIRDRAFRIGDSIMQTRNNYKLAWKEDRVSGRSLLGEDLIESFEGEGVFNGDFGFIEDMDPDGLWMDVRFDGRLARYSEEEMDELRHAYAITIHKSQGSEFPCVVLPIVAGPPMLLTRNILYTAITRAKKLVVLVGNRRILGHMIANNRIRERNSSLHEKLADLFARQRDWYEGK